MVSNTQESFLALVRQGIGNETRSMPERVDWEAIKVLADEHGLTAIVLDGIDKQNKDFPKLTINMSDDLKLDWIGEVVQAYEKRYELYKQAIAELAGFYKSYGIKMMVLKGYGMSLNYPRPQHRPCGDIDTWNFGKQKEADEVLLRETGIKVDTSEHHHTVFWWKGNLVENHYDMLITSAVKTNSQLEPILKGLAMDDSNYVEIYGEKVYLPSPNMNAVFLLRHSLNHFAAAGINLRNLLDWAFFWEKNVEKVDWVWLSELLQKYSMMDFFHIVNRICIEDLGFDQTIFPESQSSKSELKERVLEEILMPETDWKEAHKSQLIPRLVFKYRRWRSNRWKRELCYSDDTIMAFWRNVWMHILKPKTI